MDEHNSRLVENVHPSDWQNPVPAGRYNLVVIGGGTAGLVTAAGAAGLGAKVALIERQYMGGDCLNAGCVPSKCVIRSSRAANDISTADSYGVLVNGHAKIDFASVMERMRKLRARISSNDSASRFKDLGIDVFLGDASFKDSENVEVDGTVLRFKNAVIATGTRAFEPPVEGLQAAGFLTNANVFSLTELPRRFAVVGGGPIGCELAQAFQRFGSEVHMFERANQILTREDADAAEILRDAFIKEGVDLLEACEIIKVEKKGNEKLVYYRHGDNGGSIAVDEILVATGRSPNIEGLNLDAVGVAFDKRRGVHVDDRLRTTNPNIYAAGDICMKYKFTHAADAAARIVIQNTLFWGRKKLSALTVPWCTYTDPEIAHVGLTEKDAKSAGTEIDTFAQSFVDVDRAIADGEEEGFVKVHVAKGTDKILGATIVARHAGDMINELTLAMTAKIGLGTLASVIHPYPTQAEAIKRVADSYNRTRLTPFVKKLFGHLMAWRR